MFFVIITNFTNMSESGISCDIYFFTGTGNSYQAAKYIYQRSEDSNFDSRIYDTDDLSNRGLWARKHDGIVCFAYPTHGFSLPWHMLKFIVRFPRGKGKLVLINNRAGMKMGKLFTPGISGIAMLLPALIMLLKGYRIKGFVPLDTPSNWISVHPGIRLKIVESIFEKRTAELNKMWQRLISGNKYFPVKFFVQLPLDIFLIPISLAYMFFGRFMLGRTYLADNRCDGCGICAARCPAAAIKMVNNRPWWTYKCESCMRCANVCPHKAVNSSIPLMVIYTLMLTWISKTGIFIDIHQFISGLLEIIPEKIIYYLLMWIATILFTWMFYVVLFYLNRLKAFNYLIALTTPMRFWRRYIAPGFKGLYK